MSRVGQVFLWEHCLVLVTADLGPTRHPGSTLRPEHPVTQPDQQVYTLAVLHDSGGVTWPVERLEDSLIKWEEAGRRIA